MDSNGESTERKIVQKAKAFVINSREIAEIVTSICPEFGEGDYEKDLHGNYFVIGFPNPGEFAVIPSESIENHWDHIQNGPFVQLREIVR